jgi:hypothetical protein
MGAPKDQNAGGVKKSARSCGRRFRRAGEAPIRITTPGRTRLNITDAW